MVNVPLTLLPYSENSNLKDSKLGERVCQKIFENLIKKKILNPLSDKVIPAYTIVHRISWNLIFLKGVEWENTV